MRTFEIQKKSVELDILKVMQEITAKAKKEGKEGFALIHYNHDRKRLEATNGRVAFTYAVNLEGMEADASFSLSGNFLIEVENRSGWSFPCIERVIPNIEEGKAADVVSINKLNLDYKTVSVEGELCGVLGYLGVRVSGLYTGMIKNIIGCFEHIALCNDKPTVRPVLFHGHGINYVVMPMTNNWEEKAIISGQRVRQTA